MRGLVLKEMARHTKLNYQQAFREVIARAGEGMLVDTHLNEKSKKLYQQNRTLWEKIKDAFSRLSSRIKRAYKDALLQSEEARLVRQWDKETLEKAQEMWLEGVAAAAKNLRNMEGTTEGGAKLMARENYDKASESKDILNLIERVKKGSFKDNEKVELGKVPTDISKRIQELTGIDVTGYKIIVEARQVEHILKDHGENGKADHSMKNDIDIAKMMYVLSSPDYMSYGGRTQAYSHKANGFNRTADTVLYEKVIDDANNESYYVVQAAVDTKAKSVYIVTAYIGQAGNQRGNKKETSQLINATNRPNATSENGSVVVSNNNISQKEQNINTSAQKNQSRDEITLTAEEIREQEQKRWEKREKRIREYYRRRRAKNVLKRNTTKLRNSVAKKFRTLDQKLNRADKDKTIKEGLRPTAAKLLEVGDMLFPESRSLEQMAREGVADATPKEKLLLDNYVKNLDLREKMTTEEGRKRADDTLAFRAAAC